ncbi:MAG: hypothetical protein AAGC67_01040 [Myxococcota bacterium]
MSEATMPFEETEPKRRRFFAVLFGLTLLPLFALPTMAVTQVRFDSSLLLGLAIFAGGVGHVASTASVYVDRSVREVMRPMPLRFVVVPVVSIAATLGAVFWGASAPPSDAAVAGMYILHLGWLHYHYQRQNYGIIAFSAAASGTRVPRRLDRVLLLPALAGCLAVMPVFLEGAFADVTFWRPLAPWFRPASSAAFLLGVAGLAALVLREPAPFRNPRTAGFVAAAFAFFLPAVVLEHTDYAFWSYALAHGFQYLFMVFVLARGRERRLLHGAWYLVCALLGGFALHRLAGNNALFAAGILLTWVHFVLDARLWKMSEAGPRRLLRERFDFVFGASGR